VSLAWEFKGSAVRAVDFILALLEEPHHVPDGSDGAQVASVEHGDANRTETVASRTSGRRGSCPVAPAASDCTEVLNAPDRGEKDHAIVQSTRRRQRP
jgi:hypothetical protein